MPPYDKTIFPATLNKDALSFPPTLKIDTPPPLCLSVKFPPMPIAEPLPTDRSAMLLQIGKDIAILKSPLVLIVFPPFTDNIL